MSYTFLHLKQNKNKYFQSQEHQDRKTSHAVKNHVRIFYS